MLACAEAGCWTDQTVFFLVLLVWLVFWFWLGGLAWLSSPILLLPYHTIILLTDNDVIDLS